LKEFFIEKRFGHEARALLTQIDEILQRYAAQGYDLSLRQLYYQLVAANIVSNTEKSYKNVGNLVSDARLAGLIDWDAIKDRGRSMVCNSHWSTPAEILKSCVSSFQIDKWETQPCYVEVMVEKQALEGVLEPVCSILDVPFTANKGYSSSSAMYEASKRFLRRAEDDKELYVIYLGDHDPSGIDMSRDVLERLDLFIKTSLGRAHNEDSGLTVKRVALNIDQVRKLHPPENPAKVTDSRAAHYIRLYGESSWELDAIEPKALADLVTRAVHEIRDLDEWEKATKKEDSMRAELAAFAKKSKFK
jgi:hypothetical protein